MRHSDAHFTQVCRSSITCAQGFFCTLGRLVVSPFYLLAGIINQINIAIGGGQGQWTLGSGFWELLQITLLTVWGKLGPWFLTTMMSIDCITCAITGNLPFFYTCKTPLFSFWLPIIQALTRIGSALIIFATDLVKTIILSFAYLFSGNLSQFILVLWDFIQSIFLNVIIPYFEALAGFVLGFICLCTVWNGLFGDIFTCTNFPWCDGKKRAAGAASYDPFMDPAHPPRFQYERFAADWPANPAFSWPNNDPCNASMDTYAANVVAHYGSANLTRAQGEEASFCLAKILLFPPLASMDEAKGMLCRLLFQRLRDTNAVFGSLSALDYAQVQQCVYDYGIVKTLKRAATPGMIDWLPDEFVSRSDAGITNTWLPALANGIHAVVAVTMHARDVHYEASVTTSNDYRANLAQTFGPDRAALVDSATPESDLTGYAVASLNTVGHSAPPGESTPYVAAGKRRVVTQVQSPERVQSVTQLATFVRALRYGTELVTDFMPRWFERIDVHAAAAAPVPTIISDPDARGVFVVTPYTAGDMASPWAFNSTKTMTSTSFTSTDRMVQSTWRGLRAVAALGSALAQVSIELAGDGANGTVAVDRRRHLSGAATVIVDERRRPGVGEMITFLSAGLRSTLSIVRELWTGQAHANATNTNTSQPVITTVAWTLTRPEEEAARTSKDPMVIASIARRRAAASEERWRRFLGPGTAERFRTRWSALTHFSRRITDFAKHDVHVQDRTRRIQEVALMARRALTGDMSGISLAAIDNSTCLTTPTFCAQCYLMDQLLGTTTIAINATVAYYTSDNPLQPEATLDALAADYARVEGKLFGNRSAYVTFGDSPLNPALWPNKDRGTWDHYWNDGIPNKIGFSDIQPLIDATWAWIESLFSSSASASAPMGISSTASRRAAFDAAMARARARGNDVWLASLHHDLERVALAVAPRVRNVTAIGAAATPAYDTFTEIALGWVQVALKIVWTCEWPPLLQSTGLRFSFAQGFSISFVLLLVVAAFWSAFPALSVVFFGLLGFWILMGTLALGFALTTGWSLTCAAAVPPIVFTRTAMHTVTDVLLPACPLYLMALVNTSTFHGAASNEMCARCDLWESNYLTMGNCFRDYGLTSIWNVPVYFLHVYAPSFLVSLQDSQAWPMPISWFLGAGAVQTILGHYDGINLNSDDPLEYAHLNGCPYILGVPTLVVFYAVSSLLSAFAGRALFNLVRRLVTLVLMTGPYLVLSLCYQIAIIFHAPHDMIALEETA